MELKHDETWGWGIYDSNGWGIYSSDGWDSYEKVSYCFFWEICSKKNNTGLQGSTLSGRRMTTGFGPFDIVAGPEETMYVQSEVGSSYCKPCYGTLTPRIKLCTKFSFTSYMYIIFTPHNSSKGIPHLCMYVRLICLHIELLGGLANLDSCQK